MTNPNNRNHTGKTLTIILLSIYFIVLTWIILLKFSLDFGNLPHLRNINLIPYGDSAIVNGRLDLKELILNAMVFIPFGLYLSMLKPDLALWKRGAIILSVSLSYEIIQYIFAIGATDITDLINNTMGGVIGCLLYSLFAKIGKERTNLILNILALIGTIGFIVLFGIVIIVND